MNAAHLLALILIFLVYLFLKTLLLKLLEADTEKKENV
jgi:hypothetical protein